MLIFVTISIRLILLKHGNLSECRAVFRTQSNILRSGFLIKKVDGFQSWTVFAISFILDVLQQIRSIMIYITLLHGLTNGKWILILILVNKHKRSYWAVKVTAHPQLVFNSRVLASVNSGRQTVFSQSNFISFFQIEFPLLSKQLA